MGQSRERISDIRKDIRPDNRSDKIIIYSDQFSGLILHFPYPPEFSTSKVTFDPKWQGKTAAEWKRNPISDIPTHNCTWKCSASMGGKMLEFFKNHPNAAKKPQITRIASNESFESLRADSFRSKMESFPFLNWNVFKLFDCIPHSQYIRLSSQLQSHSPSAFRREHVFLEKRFDVLARTLNHRSRCLSFDSLRPASSQPL